MEYTGLLGTVAAY